VLAIDAHGTAVPIQPNDNFPASYGSMSNQILEFTAVVTDPANPSKYGLRKFTRGESDAKVFLTQLGACASRGRDFAGRAELQLTMSELHEFLGFDGFR
jgi:hypothetical protein